MSWTTEETSMATAEQTIIESAVEVGRVGADSAGLLMTPQEFDAIEDYDELCRYELIHGVLVVTAVPLEQEADPNETLGGLLFVYREQHPLGSALDRTLMERFVHTPGSRRRADRVIWAGLGRRPNPRTDPPTIAVEFVSAGKRSWKRDYEAKRDEYLALGIAEYWIFDRFARRLTVHRNSPEGATRIVVLEGEVYQTPFLPGFELPLARILQAADDWNDPA
jgi:Uma2 family endonuclease